MTLNDNKDGRKGNGHQLLIVFVQKLFPCLILISIIFACGCDSAKNSATHNKNGLIKCRDDSGNDVDWFIVYKLPKIHGSSDAHIGQGLGYAYILPGMKDWTVSTGKGINDQNSLVGLTLQPLFHEDVNTTTNLAYILYNDQPPQGPTIDSNGHTKGVIIASPGGGVWLQHSVPHFPNTQQQYDYPETGQHNGQILHCLTLDVTQVDNVGNILNLTKPHVYNFRIPDEMAQVLPTLAKVVKKAVKNEFTFVDHTDTVQDLQSNFYQYQQVQPAMKKAIKPQQKKGNEENSKIIQIQNAGRVLYSFAKGPTFHQEIYSEWIAPKFQSELDVQSWLNGPHAYPSNCSSATKVYNIEDTAVSGNKFTTHNDHSKWAIATQKPVVCIGDLNRMEHQTKRGGTVNCFMDKTVWKAFKKLVVSTQPCPKPQPLTI